MTAEKDFLREHAGSCVFPMVDPESGKRKKLCGAMTFRENGVFPPFCKEHLEEIKKIIAHRKSLKIEKKSFKASGGV